MDNLNRTEEQRGDQKAPIVRSNEEKYLTIIHSSDYSCILFQS